MGGKGGILSGLGANEKREKGGMIKKNPQNKQTSLKHIKDSIPL